jgi:hypothetical protein
MNLTLLSMVMETLLPWLQVLFGLTAVAIVGLPSLACQGALRARRTSRPWKASGRRASTAGVGPSVLALAARA